jgi:ferritin-like metal-binding protein YciE
MDAPLIDQLQDLYDAEQRLVQALPKMAAAAHQQSLKDAFQHHFRETQNHFTRLERAFQALGQTPKAKTCEAMKGLVAEGQEAIDAKGDPDVKDAALIASAQRVEHYEFAVAGTSSRSGGRTVRQRVIKVDAQAFAGGDGSGLLGDEPNEERLRIAVAGSCPKRPLTARRSLALPRLETPGTPHSVGRTFFSPHINPTCGKPAHARAGRLRVRIVAGHSMRQHP